MRIEHVEAAAACAVSRSIKLRSKSKGALILRNLGPVPRVTGAILKADRANGHFVDADALDPSGRVDVGRALRSRLREACAGGARPDWRRWTRKVKRISEGWP